MEINIEEQEAKLKAEAQRIGEELMEARKGQVMLQQKEQDLINQVLKNQGALDLLNDLMVSSLNIEV
ncbi:hypothetical protein LCGC14_0316380 [marine sediment metagenome]|uniref:Uncharacterized protein n=1 Tax=marine sediment metagenome TaxID=412755 RepID=A0A0F9W7R6_9ZZZZ